MAKINLKKTYWDTKTRVKRGVKADITFITIFLLSLLYINLVNAQPVENQHLDQFEPNNDHKGAIHVPLFESFSIELTHPDEDWFHLYIPATGILLLHYELDTSSPVRPTVELYRQQEEDISAIKFDGTTTTLSVVQLNKGSYLLKFTQSNVTQSHYPLRINYIKKKANKNTLFVLGMELSDKQNKDLQKIADIGGGKMLAVSSATGNLTLALASIAEESRGNVFNTTHFVRTLLDESLNALTLIPNKKFEFIWFNQQLNHVIDAIKNPKGKPSNIFSSNSLALLLSPLAKTSFNHKPANLFNKNFIAKHIAQAITPTH